MKKERKKGEQKLALSFFWARKNGHCSRKFRRHQDSGYDNSVCRPNGFAAQDQSSKCRFPWSALQTSPYDDRKNTKLSTTCTYYREILKNTIDILTSGTENRRKGNSAKGNEEQKPVTTVALDRVCVRV